MAEQEEVKDAAVDDKKGGAEEPEAPDCPPCPGGAPAWMATFADMATLLMAFFVLILSFAHVNVPKFKNVSGSMQMAFGVQTLIPVIEPPSATNLIATQYMTAQVEPTPVNTVEEQRTDEPPPEDPELDVDVGAGESSTNDTVEMLQAALADQIAMGQVSVSVDNAQVKVEVLDPELTGQSSADTPATRPGQLDASLLEVFATVADVAEQTATSIEIYAPLEQPVAQPSTGTSAEPAAAATSSSSMADDQYEMIRANLSSEIRSGLAEVTREGDDIIIRLAEQGSFDSGFADLKPEFTQLLNRVGSSLPGSSGRIAIEGHTDNQPMGPGSRFRSNWDLSSARAAAVADYLLNGDYVNAGQVSVSGLADTEPVSDNGTASGRAQNRRIEIIVSGS
jgi:chemotaxis protein MotB